MTVEDLSEAVVRHLRDAGCMITPGDADGLTPVLAHAVREVVSDCAAKLQALIDGDFCGSDIEALEAGIAAIRDVVEGKIRSPIYAEKCKTMITLTTITQALARGYTHQANSNKAMDPELVSAMAEEVMKVVSADRNRPGWPTQEELNAHTRRVIEGLRPRPVR